MERTSEEIQSGLKCAENARCPNKLCAFYGSNIPCIVQVQKDSLSLIQRLERDKNWASENYDLIREVNKRLEAQNAELLEKIKQLERERDALLALIREYAACETCKYECPPEKDEAFFNECIGCDKEICKCRECGKDCEHWEWRGPCEENGGQANA